MTTTGLTEQTRKALKTTVDAIRTRLVADLYAAADQRFAFAAKNRDKLPLSPQDRYDWQLLQSWCEDPIRTQQDFTGNVTALIKEVAYTLTNRLFILRQLEASRIQGLAVLTGGKESAGYREFRDFCPELCRGEDEGYGYLLQQVFDKIALDLPAFFGRNPLHGIVPLPGPTLGWLVELLNQPKLEGAWSDDTTLGWLYQYWNDPDRTAVNDKVGGKGVAKGKVEAHEIAAATQLFTERYMVEWLLQNSLGVQWLAICEKRGWQPEAIGVIETLELRRGQWREKLGRQEVPEDLAMPIESEAEERWKYYVPQEIPAEVVAAAPDSLAGVKILDPACGSGHFLVYAFDLLYAFYQEEAHLKGEAIAPEAILENIFKHNLHGIDIDPRAVQIAAAALYLKAQEKCPGFEVPSVQLVATDLGLTHLSPEDPSVKQFKQALTGEGIDPQQVDQLIASLKGADYLGSLLQFDKQQFKQSTLPLWQAHEERSFETALKQFMSAHDQGADLGVRTRAEQLAKGLRLVELLGENYQVVCANPPYLGTSKLEKSLCESLQANYSDFKADLYSIFIARCSEMVQQHGIFAMVTMRGWMFISQFEELRKYVLDHLTLAAIGDVDRGAFNDMKDVAAAMFTVFKGQYAQQKIQIVKPVPSLQISRDRLQVGRNIRGLLTLHRTFSFSQSKFQQIEGTPLIYWWPEEFRQVYLQSPKVKNAGQVRSGCQSNDNNRFLRNWYEVNLANISLANSSSNQKTDLFKTWQPYLKGASGKRWFESIDNLIKWKYNGKEVKIFAAFLHKSASKTVQSQDKYFIPGIAYNSIGNNSFSGRMSLYKSIFGRAAPSVFHVTNQNNLCSLFNSKISVYIIKSLNPTINIEVGDVEHIPLMELNIDEVFSNMRNIFEKHLTSNELFFEYRYFDLTNEIFSKEEIIIRSTIDREIYRPFTPVTVSSIKEEVGESPGNYPQLNEDELAHSAKFHPNFTDIYLNGPTKTEFGEVVTKSDGTPERGRLQSLEELCHEFQLHPESIIALRKHLGLKRKSDSQQEAYRHLAWAMGVALGRFDAQTGGLVDLAAERRGETPIDPAAPKALSKGMFMLSERAEVENLPADDPTRNQGLEASFKEILRYRHGDEVEAIWDEIRQSLVYDCKTELKAKDLAKLSFNQFMRDSAFAFHKDVYENRPIYFPLCSAKRAYVVWCNIHAWHDSTLKDVLAVFLVPEHKELDLRLKEITKAKLSTDDTATRQKLRNAEEQLRPWFEELNAMIDLVQQIADRGVSPEKQERERPFVMDLDDGVMINSAALWPLLQPLWKDPKKWWEHLEKPVGKNDYDWSHLAMRYWPNRVWKKLEKDPSLAVAHSDYGEYVGRDIFKELHPAMATKWEAEQAKR
jgi:SAM-dependent methyltransferase